MANNKSFRIWVKCEQRIRAIRNWLSYALLILFLFAVNEKSG